jgi:hypothetical protein
MPVSILFCNDLPKVACDLPKTIPTNKILRVKKMPEEVTICFEMKLLKSDIPVQNKAEEVWRDNIWKQILQMRNLDDKITLDNENNFFNKILKEDFHADINNLKSAIASTICVKALEKIETPLKSANVLVAIS